MLPVLSAKESRNAMFIRGESIFLNVGTLPIVCEIS
jgi:hypothetical protein